MEVLGFWFSSYMNKNKGTALAFSWFHYLTYPIPRVWHFCSPFPTQTTAWTHQSPWTVIHEPNKLAFQWRAQACWRCGAPLSAHRIPAFRLAHSPGGPAFPSNLARNTKPSSRISPASFSLCLVLNRQMLSHSSHPIWNTAEQTWFTNPVLLEQPRLDTAGLQVPGEVTQCSPVDQNIKFWGEEALPKIYFRP